MGYGISDIDLTYNVLDTKPGYFSFVFNSFWAHGQLKVKVDKSMPRTNEKVNYKTNDLIEVIENKLPQGAEGWKEVAVLYKVKSSEDVLRDYEDLKLHWGGEALQLLQETQRIDGIGRV
jgi:hypothetical protein